LINNKFTFRSGATPSDHHVYSTTGTPYLFGGFNNVYSGAGVYNGRNISIQERVVGVGQEYQRIEDLYTPTGILQDGDTAKILTGVYQGQCKPVKNTFLVGEGPDLVTVENLDQPFLNSTDMDSGTFSMSGIQFRSTIYGKSIAGNGIIIGDGAGGFYISGTGYYSTRSGVVHINANAELLPDTYNINPLGAVNTLCLDGTTLYVGGTFTTIQGVARNRIAAFDTTTGLITSWNPDSNGAVKQIVVSGSTVYCCGSFTTIGGQSRKYLAGLSTSTGLATSLSVTPTGTDIITIVLGTTTIYIGGSFSKIGATSRANLAEITISSSALTSWNPTAAGSVNKILLDSGTIYACGSFTGINTGPVVTRNHLAAINASTGIVTAWNPAPDGAYTNNIKIVGTKLYLAGSFGTVGAVTCLGFAEIDLSTGLATAFTDGASGYTDDCFISGGYAYVTGAFQSFGPINHWGLAQLDLATGLVTSWNTAVVADIGFGEYVYINNCDFKNGYVHHDNRTTTGQYTRLYFDSCYVDEYKTTDINVTNGYWYWTNCEFNPINNIVISNAWGADIFTNCENMAPYYGTPNGDQTVIFKGCNNVSAYIDTTVGRFTYITFDNNTSPGDLVTLDGITPSTNIIFTNNKCGGKINVETAGWAGVFAGNSFPATGGLYSASGVGTFTYSGPYNIGGSKDCFVDAVMALLSVDPTRTSIQICDAIYTKASRTITAGDTSTATDYMIRCNSATPITLALLPSATVLGQDLLIKNINTGVVTVDGDGSEPIDDTTTKTLNQWDCLAINANGTGWDIV
jgi:hypothetical protein